MKNIFKRSAHLPIVSRKNVGKPTRTINTVYGSDIIYLVKDCMDCLETKPLDSFYVKQNKQNIPDDELLPRDHRNICCECFDAKGKHRPRRKKSEIKREKMLQEENTQRFLALLDMFSGSTL